MASIGSRVKKMLQMAENIVNNTTDSKSSNYLLLLLIGNEII